MFTRQTFVGVAVVLSSQAALQAAPAVVRVSEDLRGATYATVWGEGFVEGKTIVRMAAQARAWDAAKAKAALEAGVDLGAATQPPARARRVEPLWVRADLMLLRLGLPSVAPR